MCCMLGRQSVQLCFRWGDIMCWHFHAFLSAGVILGQLAVSCLHGLVLPDSILVVKLEFACRRSPLQLSVLPTLPVASVKGRGGALGDHALVPVPVVLQRVENVLCVRLNQVSPCLPQWVDDVIDEANLECRRARRDVSKSDRN